MSALNEFLANTSFYLPIDQMSNGNTDTKRINQLDYLYLWHLYLNIYFSCIKSLSAVTEKHRPVKQEAGSLDGETPV